MPLIWAYKLSFCLRLFLLYVMVILKVVTLLYFKVAQVGLCIPFFLRGQQQSSFLNYYSINISSYITFKRYILIFKKVSNLV